jgi:esterase/lipase superfamily enzyme
MTGADLTDASLQRAKMAEAILRNCILDGARLDAADLTRADLTAALVTQSQLRVADCSGAILPENLYGARSPAAPSEPAHGAGSLPELLVDRKAGFTAKEPERSGDDVDVWFGTNRKPVNEGPSLAFSGERDDQVHLGRCTVRIPAGHRIGSLGSSWCRRCLLGDDRITVRSIKELEERVFWGEIARHLSEVAPLDRTALVYIHGYNNSFAQAAKRAAQLGADLGAAALTAFFSWPSKGRASGYAADEATIEASSRDLGAFLLGFVGRTGATAVHIIAHSMGNRGLARALADAAQQADSHGVRFGQLLLAAPDMDSGVFKQLAEAYVALAARTTLYVSDRDIPVKASERLHEFPRVGRVPPITVVPGIDTVEVGGVDMTALGHTYHGHVRPVLVDMFQAIRNGMPPERRAHLRAAACPEGTYWTLRP